MLFTIRQLVEKNIEWKKDISLCILDTDIAKAYDHVTYGLVEKGLKSKGVPKPIIAAWLREWSQMKSTMRLNQDLRGMHGYSTGAIQGNLPRERIGIS